MEFCVVCECELVTRTKRKLRQKIIRRRFTIFDVMKRLYNYQVVNIKSVVAEGGEN